MMLLKLVFGDAWRYWRFYLVRSVLLQLLLTNAGAYLLGEVFQVVLFLVNQNQLTQANLRGVVFHPLGLLGTLFYLALLAFLIYLEFFALVNIIHRKDRRLSWSRSSLTLLGHQFWKSVSGWQLLPFLAYLLLTIPTVQWLLSSALFQRLYIPYFITDELMKQPLTALVLLSLGAVAYYLNLRLMYSLPLMALGQGRSFWDNMSESWRLTRRNLLSLIGSLVALSLPFIAVLAGLTGLLFFVLMWMEQQAISQVLQWAVFTFFWGIFFAVSALSRLVLVSFLLRKVGAGQLLPIYHDLPVVSKKRWLSLLSLLFLLGLGQFVLNTTRLTYTPYNQEVETIAHRGDVTQGVENSLEALEGAARFGVDYVETDIIMTADGQFVVSHDNNLKRLTGQGRLISQSQLSELVGLPISQDGKVSQLVAFDTYVTWAQHLGVKLMVELKPHGGEPDDYAQRVVSLLRELGVSRDYKLMSLDLDVMLTIEALAPEIETGYIIPFQFGHLAGEDLDFLLLEEFSYRDHLAWEAQWRGQDLYVWTINREDQVVRYLQSPVSGMITDELLLVSEVKAELSEETGLVDQMRRLLN